MSAQEKRQTQILELAHRQGFVSIEALAQRFSVTPQTIRRDINALCDSSQLQRYHGGAGLPSSVENIAYSARQVLFPEQKRRIAEAAARQIPDQASLFINIGTTTEEVAKALMDHRSLRVITNNLNVANILSGNPEFEVIVAGGLVRSRDRGIVGAAAVDLIRQFLVDIAIIGISGIAEDGTLLDFDYREVRVAQAIMENARQVFLVADHSKFGRKPLVRLGHIAQLDALITDEPPPKAIQALLQTAGVALHVAASRERGEDAA